MTPTPRHTPSTCPYCGVGCGVLIEAQGTQITGVRGDPEHPANFGRLCSKGSTLHLTARETVTLQTRLLQPMRRPARGAAPVAVGWDAALDELATRIADVTTRRGPDALGLYISGQLLTEDYYVFNKLAKGLLGTNNVDTNSRLCMSSAVAGYKATLGADAPPCSYEDLDHAATVFIAGSNMAWAHPVLFRRLEDAKRAKPQQRWIVVDPRRTETAAAADLHLQLLPGTDVALFNGLLHLLLWEGLTDAAYIAAHTSGFEALRDAVRNATPAATARACGLREADIVQAARWFGGSIDPATGRRSPTLSLYCQGLNQSTSGTDKNAALINLHLATRQIGQPGAGPFSLTGQPNAMGGREVGGMATLLSAHRDLTNPAHRAEVAALWGIDEVPATPGKAAVQLFEAAADGAIELLWVACTNPAQSLPDQAMVRRALQRCPFVVVQDAYAGIATARHADLLLPASSWGEKEGTVTNSERRISRVRAAVPPPGQARHDWQIVVDLARRLEQRLPARRADGGTLFPYETTEQIWNEHRESTRGRDLDITGLSWAMLDEQGAQQWPLPEGAAQGQARLYADGHYPTPDGRARFAAVQPRALAEPRDARFPFSLNTGRLRDHWHGLSRTGTLGRLYGHVAEPVIELHPSDLARLRVSEGALLRVQSRRGELVLPVQASTEVAPTQAWLPMHWGEEVLGGRHRGGINALTTPATCPQSRQPELKHTAVRLAPAALPWQLQARAWLPAAEALQRREALLALCSELDYAACMPFGREADTEEGTPGAVESPGLGIWLRAAAAEPPPAGWLQQVEALLGLQAANTLRYADLRRGQWRSARLQPGTGAPRPLLAFVLAGETRAAGWVGALLQAQQDASDMVRAVLAAGATPPQALLPRSAQVCTCFDVREDAIAACLTRNPGPPQARLAVLQAELRCGTNCGSCLPALRQRAARGAVNTQESPA